MVKNPKILAVTFFGLGMLLGYAAATGNLNPFPRTDHLLAQANEAAASQPEKRPAKDDGKAGKQPAKDAKKPNIVFVLMDNLGYGEVGCYGGGQLRGAATPRIDKLAREGKKLLNFNVEPQCTPSRSAIMTGRFALRSGTHSVPIPGGLYGLVPWEVTIAGLLSAKGYATGHFGKWHLGNVEGRLPNDHGFDEWYGIPDTSDESLWPSQQDFDPKVARVAHILEGKKGEKSSEVAVFDLKTKAEIDMEITKRAIDFMKRSAAAKKPFYTYVPYTAVHYPNFPSAAFKGKTGHGDWADGLAQMDHNIGRLLDAIEDLGLRDDTIFVFTSDNGADTSTPPWIGTAGPWSGTMFTPMEGSNRAPFIVRWPGKVPADRESNEIVHEMDTFTTLARFADADVPKDRPIDGVDQSDFLLGKTERSAREGFPIYFGDKLYAAKWRNYKLHFVWQVNATDPVQTLGVPKLFDLLTNPKEDPSQDLLTTHLWVMQGASKMIGEYQASLKKYPPIPMGAPDSYVPPKP
jgi:arylsulfatase A-like enzyme